MFSDIIKIYTDGSCIGNPGAGGYALLILRDTKEYLKVGGLKRTTNNAMELTAVLESLKILSRLSATKLTVKLYTDSQYVIKGCTEWKGNWIRNQYRTKQNKPIKNKELWEQIFPLYDKVNKAQKLELIWVKGHSGDFFNEKVDKAARNEANKFV